MPPEAVTAGEMVNVWGVVSFYLLGHIKEGAVSLRSAGLGDQREGEGFYAALPPEA